MIRSKLLASHSDTLGFAVSEISDSNMSFTWGETAKVSTDRDTFWQKQGLRLEDSAGMLLTHGTDIQVVDQKDAGKGTLDSDDYFNVDALMTDTKGLVLYVLTADCCPIILFDPIKAALAVAHASWKNTDQEFIRLVVEKMVSQYGTKASDLVVYIAPAIHSQSYVFPATEINIAQRKKPNWQPYLQEQDGNLHIDIVAYNVDQLTAAGVKPENVEDSGIDTYSSVNFFSHRQSVVESKPEGRFVTLVWLKKD